MEAKPGEYFFQFGKKVVPPQTSIHPRVRNGRTVFKKVNTKKAKGAEPHARRH